MAKRARGAQRREESLSRERIIKASIELLDSSGEEGLTFRALSERLATGPGAIYWHIANKNDLLAAACDSVVARTINETVVVTTPEATIRAVALGLFDVIDEHRWVGSVLTSIPGLSPFRTHRPADSRSWRAGRSTVGGGGRFDGLHPWCQQTERGQRAARSDAGPRSIRLP
jgi:AcrR family transcriptional regulator